MTKAYLVLENGAVFEGTAFGAQKDCVGELVFTTGMCGYIETLTDPSYAGQIVVQTFPLIGNYGMIPADREGSSLLNGYVVREICETPSNFRAETTVDAYLKKHGIPGICGVDTREITRILRDHGVMNAGIFHALPADLSALQAYTVSGAVSAASCMSQQIFEPEGDSRFRVVLLDYGRKQNIIRALNRRGCTVMAVPSDTSAREILAADPDGIVLSNGPGDPAENTACIRELRELIGKKPVFGICLGHQLAALAMGGQTYKMKFGHRGVNQPVRDAETGRVYITSQNHGYAVDEKSLAGRGTAIFTNANDGSCEGMLYPAERCFTVQFHPEACSGPHDTAFLFDRFLRMMEEQYAERSVNS